MAKRQLSSAQLAVVQAARASRFGERAVIQNIRVACSGGADSLALAASLAWLDSHEPDPLFRCGAMVVDHGLQPETALVSQRVAAVVSGFGLPTSVVAVAIEEKAGGLEAAARQARYGALTSGDVDVVLTGHTMDDQAETVLLGLLRGSGTRSLAGMPAKSLVNGCWLIRPLLTLRRSTTRQACFDWGLEPWDDPMNDDDRFARVRARRLLPSLESELGPGVVEALARTADLARLDADYLDELAEQRLRLGQVDLPVVGLLDEPSAIRSRMVRRWLAGHGVTELSFERTMAVLALVEDWHGQIAVKLPGGQVVRRDGRLIWDE